MVKNLTIFLILLSTFAHAQTKNFSGRMLSGQIVRLPNTLLLGANIARYPSVEIGYGRFRVGERLFYGFTLSTEHFILEEYRLGIKPKLLLNSYGFQVGLATPVYFDLKGESSFRIRPEIGFGLGTWSVSYAVNIPVSKNPLPFISIHNLNFVYHLFWDKGKTVDTRYKNE